MFNPTGRRHRKSDTVLENSNERVISFCSPASHVTTSYAGCNSGIFREMTDYVTPRFVQRIAKGEVINNRCDSIVATYSCAPTGYEHARPGYPGSCGLTPSAAYKDYTPSLLGRIYGPLDHKTVLGAINDIPVVDMESEASTKALSHVRAPDVQGAVSIAEMRETLRTLRNPIKALTGLTQKYRHSIRDENRRRQRRAAQLRVAYDKDLRARIIKQNPSQGDARALAIAQGAGSQYLAYIYGIRPIMQDIDGTLDALFHDNWTERFTARGLSEWTDQVVDEATTSVGNPLTSVTLRTTRTIEAKIRAGFMYQHRYDLGDRLGLQVSQVPIALWEVVPYSFVVDWAFNVGEVISALTAAATTQPLAQWLSHHYTITVEREIISTGFDATKGFVVTLPCQDQDKVVVEVYSRNPSVRLWANIALRARFPLRPGNMMAALSLLLQKL